MTAPSATTIAGVGQRLAGDDGVGPAIIDHLRRDALPDGVSLHEVREPSALFDLLGARAPLVIVDAVWGERPGEVLELAPGDVEARGLTSVSSHGLSVGQVLALAGAISGAPADRVRILAVTIARAARGVDRLSPEVAAAIPLAAARALALARGPAAEGQG